MRRSGSKILAYIAFVAFVFVVTSGVTTQLILLPRAKAQLTEDLDAIYNPQRVEVRFGTRAFLLDLVTGKIPRLVAQMDEVDSAQTATDADRFITPVKFSKVTFDLSKVHFERRQILGGAAAFRAEDGIMTARLEEAEFNKFLRAEGFAITTTLDPGEISITADVTGDSASTFRVSGKAALEITNTSFALVPQSIDQKGVETQSAKKVLGAVFPVPPIAGIKATSVEILDGYLILQAHVTRVYGETSQDIEQTFPEGSDTTDTLPRLDTGVLPPRPAMTSPSPSPTSKPTRTPSPLSTSSASKKNR